MKKFRRKKLAFAFACASIFGCKTQADQNIKTEQSLAAVGGVATFCNDKPVQGLSKNQKLAITTIASLVGIIAIGFAVWGVKKHLEVKNQNIKIIEKQSGLHKEHIDRLIGFIKSEDNSFLDNISSVCGPDGKVYEKKGLDEEVIKEVGISWVERFFDDLRFKSKIYKIKSESEGRCLVYTNETSWVRFTFFSSYNEYLTKTGDGFRIENDKGWVISYQIR